MNTPPMPAPIPGPIPVSINMGAPSPGIFRLALQVGPIGLTIDLPNDQWAQIMGQGLQRLQAAASRILVVPGMPQGAPPGVPR